jgi:hypothetical protein
MYAKTNAATDDIGAIHHNVGIEQPFTADAHSTAPSGCAIAAAAVNSTAPDTPILVNKFFTFKLLKKNVNRIS